MSVSPIKIENMPVRVELTRENEVREVKVPSEATVMDLIRSMDLPLDGVLVLSGNVPIPLDLPVREAGDDLKVINVASGG